MLILDVLSVECGMWGQDGRSTARWGRGGMCTHTHNKIRLLRKARLAQETGWGFFRSMFCREKETKENQRADPPSNEKRHVDTYYKYDVKLCFWVGSL